MRGDPAYQGNKQSKLIQRESGQIGKARSGGGGGTFHIKNVLCDFDVKRTVFCGEVWCLAGGGIAPKATGASCEKFAPDFVFFAVIGTTCRGLRMIREFPNERWSAAEKRHFSFLHSIGRCALTRRTDGIEIAHIRVHTGMALKPNWRHVLPLTRSVHEAQERAGLHWWGRVGFEIGSDQDPRKWAELLASVAGDVCEAEDVLARMFRRSRKDILKQAMMGEMR